MSILLFSLNYDDFCEVLDGNTPLLTKIFRNELVIPEFESFCENVTRLYEKFKDNQDGAVRFFQFCDI